MDRVQIGPLQSCSGAYRTPTYAVCLWLAQLLARAIVPMSSSTNGIVGAGCFTRPNDGGRLYFIERPHERTAICPSWALDCYCVEGDAFPPSAPPLPAWPPPAPIPPPVPLDAPRPPVHPDPVDRRRNLRLALILASVAAMFFIGFVVKIVLLGKA